MKATLYGIMGVLAHEKTPVWTDKKPNRDEDTYITTSVDIPEDIKPYETVDGSIAVELDGVCYLLFEVLRDKDGDPVIAWHPYGNEIRKTISLK